MCSLCEYPLQQHIKVLYTNLRGNFEKEDIYCSVAGYL